VRDALSQLTIGQPEADEAAEAGEQVLEEEVARKRDRVDCDARPEGEPKVRLNDQRLEAVLAALRAPADPPIKRVVDMGCGEGQLLRALLEDRQFAEVVGVDVASATLERAEKRLARSFRASGSGSIGRAAAEPRPGKPQHVRDRVKLLQGSLVYRDRRLEGFDALALVEVIEHVDRERLDVVRKVLFAHLRPRRVVLTTPNAEYNVRFETLPAGKMRPADHRFEWTRGELRAWAAGAEPHGDPLRVGDVGPGDPEVGAPTQMAIFDRVGVATS
jgi:3' terminal RNA ribose 2'-O-methyltransferase Hen1